MLTDTDPAALFAVLADPSRLHILAVIRAKAATQVQLVDAVGLRQPTVSHHLRILLRHGLVCRDHDKAGARYRLTARASTMLTAARRVTRNGPGVAR